MPHAPTTPGTTNPHAQKLSGTDPRNMCLRLTPCSYFCLSIPPLPTHSHSATPPSNMRRRPSLFKHLLVWLASAAATLSAVHGQGQGQEQQQSMSPTQWGAMEDLSTFPTVSNATFAPRQGDGSVDQTLYLRPTLSVNYDAFVNFTTPKSGSIQIYKVSVANDGPGDVTQLAVKIEDFNLSSSWWGLNTLDGNDTYQYLPKYRAPLRQGDKWTFGLIQNTNRSSFAKAEVEYGQTGDGRFFNLTSIIPSPANPDGTDAELVEEDVKESYWKDQRYVIWSGRVTNTGSYPLSGVGVDVENITAATGTWHLVYDPATNTTYLPLRDGFLHPKESQHFGFIMPAPEGQPNVSLSYVTTPNALYNITAPNVFNDKKPKEFLPPRMGSNMTLEQSSGGLHVPYPPHHARIRPGQQQEGQQQQGQQQQGGEQQYQGEGQQGQQQEGQQQQQQEGQQQQQQQQPQEQRGEGQQGQQQQLEQQAQGGAGGAGQGEQGGEGGNMTSASGNQTQAEKTLVKGGVPLKKKIHHRLREMEPGGRH